MTRINFLVFLLAIVAGSLTSSIYQSSFGEIQVELPETKSASPIVIVPESESNPIIQGGGGCGRKSIN
ncbi:MAG: hypothetical protein HKN33_18390 [Pyrinomonadaceae bacterium]|nr:hypothetical protein [Pyrinomonadaceae bacterium]